MAVARGGAVGSHVYQRGRGGEDSLVVGLAYSPKNMVGYFLEKTKILLAGSCLSRPLRSVNLWFPWSCWRVQEGGLALFGYMV